LTVFFLLILHYLLQLELPSTREFIISHATIYGKKKNRALTSYEEAINNAALELALENPLLISKKGSLFDLAKKKLLENGYQYKRGSSRSKLKEETAYNSNKRISSTTTTTTTLSMTDSQQHRDILAKRQENAQIMSDKRLEKIQILQLQVDQALKCRQATENKLSNNESHGALTRLTMEADLIRYEETKIKLTKEISKLKAQERKHQWYKRRKLERCCTNTTDEGFSSQNSTSSTGSSGSSSASAYNCNPNITHQHQHQQQYHHHHSAFSICGPPQLPPPPSSSTQYTLPSTSHHPHYHQEQQDDDDYLSYSSSSSPSSSSISSTTTTTTLLTCSRESDVRASSISNYDR
jgi:hypothetical protein